MKTSRRRLDVDVEELDRVIDAAENGPLSKADRLMRTGASDRRSAMMPTP